MCVFKIENYKFDPNSTLVPECLLGKENDKVTTTAKGICFIILQCVKVDLTHWKSPYNTRSSSKTPSITSFHFICKQNCIFLQLVEVF